ncbi:FUSC family protein [Planococcus rifietoensis]|uniref:FUSC family protein n=1 Tax=Planococcus rifietoensis TaxID=200991 RepID=UPI00384CA615
MKRNRIAKNGEFRRLLKQAFAINQRPLPWAKALAAGISSGLPVLIGVLLGQLQYGLIAGLGGLAFLYMFNEPYALRSKKIFFAALGLAFSAGLGVLLSQQPILAAAAVGLIGALAVFIFGAYQFTGPTAIFFVLVFLINNNMTDNPALFLLHGFLVFLGGMLSWLMAMWAFPFKPHAAEAKAVKQGYMALTALAESAGSAEFYEVRQHAWSTLKSAETALSNASAKWTRSNRLVQLTLLHAQATSVYAEIIKRGDRYSAVSKETVENLRLIASSVEASGKKSFAAAPRLQTETGDALTESTRKAYDILTGQRDKRTRDTELKAEPFKAVFANAFNKHSMVFFAAIRFGVVLAFAAFVAHFLPIAPSYWVPLSAAAVMSGATILSTFNRSLQRSAGTIVGIVVAAVILSFQPDGLFIALMIFALTALTELAIVLNYAVAAFFITPNALMIAESTSQIGDLSYFASARIVDVLIGSAIGLIGVLLIGRRRASTLLPPLMSKTLRSQQRFMSLLFSPYSPDIEAQPIEQKKMRTNLSNLKLVLDTAQGELPQRPPNLALLQQVFFASEQLAFLLENAAQKDRLALSPVQLGQLHLFFEMMANALEGNWPFAEHVIPEIPGFPEIEQELAALQETVRMSTRKIELHEQDETLE